MKQEKLNEVFRLHKMFLNRESKGVRADLRIANLRRANLEGANLFGANLEGACLEGAYLEGACLYEANLYGADLYRAYLRGANLRRANLKGANLAGADLEGACIEGAHMPMYSKWSHSIIDGKIQIGCETKTIEDWDNFFDSDEVIETQRGTEDFLQIHAMYDAYKAYLNRLNTKI